MRSWLLRSNFVDNDIQPVLSEVLGFVSSALQTHSDDQTKIAELSQKLAQQETVTLEKVAALQKTALDVSRIPSVINTMVSLRLVSPLEGEKIASKLKEEPNAVFDLLVKVADALVNPGEGQEFMDTLDRRSDDPDGWFTRK